MTFRALAFTNCFFVICARGNSSAVLFPSCRKSLLNIIIDFHSACFQRPLFVVICARSNSSAVLFPLCRKSKKGLLNSRHLLSAATFCCSVANELCCPDCTRSRSFDVLFSLYYPPLQAKKEYSKTVNVCKCKQKMQHKIVNVRKC